MLAENGTIALIQYTHHDDHDMYLCWQDVGTQKGYNCLFDTDYDNFRQFDIAAFPFWATIIDKTSGARVGTIRLSPDAIDPDLAIWIYPKHRNKGYGKQAFALAVRYIFEHFEHEEITAGCYPDNAASLQLLKEVGFQRHPDSDAEEINCFTREPTVQLGFRLSRGAAIVHSVRQT